MRKKVQLILVLLLIFFISEAPSSFAYLKKVKAPAFRLYNLNGEIRRLSHYRGKIVILNFFATWCPPCRMEIPGFVKFYKKYRKKGVVILGICLDANDKYRVKNFVKQYRINYPVLVGNRDVAMDYGGIRAIPTTFIINQDGYIVDKIVGYLKEDILKTKIDKLIKIAKSKKKNTKYDNKKKNK